MASAKAMDKHADLDGDQFGGILHDEAQAVPGQLRTRHLNKDIESQSINQSISQSISPPVKTIIGTLCNNNKSIHEQTKDKQRFCGTSTQKANGIQC